MDIVEAQNTAHPGESVTIKTKDGKILKGTAGNEINSSKVLAVKDEAGKITVFSGSSPTEQTRSLSIREKRPQPISFNNSVKILAVKELDDKFEFYLGGDRSPKKVWEKAKPISINYAWITNTGKNLNDWILTVSYYDQNIKTYIPDEFKGYFDYPDRPWRNSTLMIKVIDHTGEKYTYEEGNNYFLVPRGPGCMGTDLEQAFLGYFGWQSDVNFNYNDHVLVNTIADWNNTVPRVEPMTGFQTNVWLPSELNDPDNTQYNFNGGMVIPDISTANQSHDNLRNYFNNISNGAGFIESIKNSPNLTKFALSQFPVDVGRYFVYPNHIIANISPYSVGVASDPDHPIVYYLDSFFNLYQNVGSVIVAPFFNSAAIGLDVPFDRSEDPYFSSARFSLSMGTTVSQYYAPGAGIKVLMTITCTDNLYRPVININKGDRLLDKVSLSVTSLDYEYKTRKMYFSAYGDEFTFGDDFTLNKINDNHAQTTVNNTKYDVTYKSNSIYGTKYYQQTINQYERHIVINGLWAQGEKSVIRAKYEITNNKNETDNGNLDFSLTYYFHLGDEEMVISQFDDFSKEYDFSHFYGQYTALDFQYYADNLIKRHIYRCPSDEDTYNQLLDGNTTITIKDYIIKESSISFQRSTKEKVKGFNSIKDQETDLKIYSISYYPQKT